MKERINVFFEQENPGYVDKKLSIINKALSDYAQLKGLPSSYLKIHLKRIKTAISQSFFYKDDLIISIQEGIFFNGVSYEIRYSLNDQLI